MAAAKRGTGHLPPAPNQHTSTECPQVTERARRTCDTGQVRHIRAVRSGAVACNLIALCIDARDPIRLSHSWADVLGWELSIASEGITSLLPKDDTGFRIDFAPTQEQKVGQNQMHMDLTSRSIENNSRRWRGRSVSALSTLTSVNAPKRVT